MRSSLLRFLGIAGCVVWSARALGCDPSKASTQSSFVDTDGDGLSDTDEMALYGTSPVLADTDGDGMTDYNEVVTHAFNADTQPLLFNPRVADVPEMVVQLAGPPSLLLNLTTTDGQTWSYEVAQTFENSWTYTLGTTEDFTFAGSVGASDSVTKEISVDFANRAVNGGDSDAGAATQARRNAPVDGNTPVIRRAPIVFDPGGPNGVTLTSSASATVDWSNTSSVTLSFNAEQQRQFRSAITYAQGYAYNHQVSATGADLIVLVNVFNTGTQPFTVTNFLMSASMLDPSGVEIPIGNLYINTNLTSYVPFSVAPGGRQGPFNCVRQTLTLEQFARLTESGALKLNVGMYDLNNQDNKPYVFHVPDIVARTATVDIDYGGMRPHERYYVATNLDPARPGIALDRALREVLRIPFADSATQGLLSVRNVEAVEAGHWTVELRHNEGGEPVTTAMVPPYDVKSILLRAGDVLHLSWSAP